MHRSPEAGSRPGSVRREQIRGGRQEQIEQDFVQSGVWNVILRAGGFEDFKAETECNSLEVIVSVAFLYCCP